MLSFVLLMAALPDTDYRTHDYGLFPMVDGVGELREYEENGLHDYTLWTLLSVTRSGKLAVVLMSQRMTTISGRTIHSFIAFVMEGERKVATLYPAKRGKVVFGKGNIRVGKERFPLPPG